MNDPYKINNIFNLCHKFNLRTTNSPVGGDIEADSNFTTFCFRPKVLCSNITMKTATMTRDKVEVSKTLVDSRLIQHANKVGIKLRSATQVQKPNHSWRRENTLSKKHRKKNSVPIGWTDSRPQQAYVDDSLVRDHSHFNESPGCGMASDVFTVDQYDELQKSAQHSLDPYDFLYGSQHKQPTKTPPSSKITKTNAWSTKAQCNHTLKQNQELLKNKTRMEPHPHQVDLRYYLSGLKLPLFSRYFVDQDNLKELKRLARIRKKAPHYGRGLSKYKYWGLSTATHLPAPHDFTEEEHAIVDQIMISKRSGYSKDYYTDDQLNYLKHIFDNKLEDFRPTLNRSHQSWMHVQPPPSPQHAFCIMCTVCQEYSKYFDELQIAEDQNAWNLQLPEESFQKPMYHRPPSTALAKYAEGWNHSQTCTCRTPRDSPEIDGVFGYPAPTRTCSPQSTTRETL